MREVVTSPKELIWNEANIRGSLSERVVIDPEKTMAEFAIAMQLNYVEKTTGEKKERLLWHNVITYQPEDIALLSTLEPRTMIEVKGRLTTSEDTWDKAKTAHIILSGDSSTLHVITSVKDTVPYAYVTLIGNVGNTPQLLYDNNSGGFASINLAVNNKWVDKNTQDEKQRTDWHTVVVAGLKGAMFAHDHLTAGTCIQVHGKLHYEHWKDKNGVEHTKPRIFVNAMEQLKILEFTPQKDTAAPMQQLER